MRATRRRLPAPRLAPGARMGPACQARTVSVTKVSDGGPARPAGLGRRRAVCGRGAGRQSAASGPGARRVSAIWLGTDSDGWQHRNSSFSESSRSATALAGVRGRVRGTAGQFRLRRRGDDRVLAPATRTVAAGLIDQDAGRDRQQPAARALRDPVLGPALRGLEQRLLAGVLAGAELAVAARGPGSVSGEPDASGLTMVYLAGKLLP